MKLNAKVINGFVNKYLRGQFDSPVEVPEFHKEMWQLVLDNPRRVAIAAPRGFAKSTAITHSLTLALFLFRIKDYGLIVSSTERKACQFLGDLKTELQTNEALRMDFKIKNIVKDAITDIIVEFLDGSLFRIQAIGAEQNPRGAKWNNRRPNLIICDDIETDEVVENDERREDFRSWFFKVLVPCLSKSGQVVMVGTILHMDSLLNRLMKNKSWSHKLYRAHKSFDDFSELLWPEQWPIERLKELRQEYMDEGFAEGYSCEVLNDPTANSDAFFRKEDFKPIEEEFKDSITLNYAAVDLAISDADKAAYTVMVVGGMDDARRLHIKHVLRFRGDANEIIEAMFEIQRTYGILLWKIEKGQIERTLLGPLFERMNEKNTYLNISTASPTKDKRSRARAIQARMRAGGVYFDKEAGWYPAFEQELLQFPKGMYKDQVDAIAWLGIAINELTEGPTKEERLEEEYEDAVVEFGNMEMVGRSSMTGY